MNNFKLKSVTLLICLYFLFSAQPHRAQSSAPPIPEDVASALKLFQSGEKQKAIEQLDDIIKKRPNDSQALLALGTIYAQNQSYGFARPLYERYILFEPNDGLIWTRLAMFRWLAAENAGAVEAANKALALKVDNPILHEALATSFMEKHDYNAALREAEKALALDDNFVFATFTKHFALRALNCTEKAIANLEDYLQRQPQNELWQNELKYLQGDLKNNPGEVCLISNNTESNGLSSSKNSADSGVANKILDQPNITANKENISADAAAKVSIEKMSIQEKQRANYTDAARKAGHCGTVRLKILFSRDGTIAAVRMQSYLLYGLTEQAIIAAKSIKFTPEKRNGVLVSVSKTIEYNFNLY